MQPSLTFILVSMHFPCFAKWSLLVNCIRRLLAFGFTSARPLLGLFLLLALLLGKVSGWVGIFAVFDDFPVYKSCIRDGLCFTRPRLVFRSALLLLLLLLPAFLTARAS